MRAFGCPDAWACACACVHVALLIQHATRMRHIVTSFVAPLVPPYFFEIRSQMARFSKKNVTERKMCFDFLYNFWPKYFSF